MKQRSVGIAILLTIITCGIYGIYWLIMLNDETNYVSGHQQDGTSGGVVFLLTLVTCNIYGYYWAYKQGERIDNAKNERGIPSSNSNVLYLILAIFGLYIVVYILTQDSLNKIADYDMNMNGGGFGGYNGPMNGGYNGPTNNGNGPM
mgnify:CR=1 FL=1